MRQRPADGGGGGAAHDPRAAQQRQRSRGRGGAQTGQQGPGDRELQRRGGERGRRHAPDGTRPAQLVLPQGAERCLRHRRSRHGVGQPDPQAQPADVLAEQVVVRQVAGQRLQPTGAGQRRAVQRHGGAEAILPPQHAREQRAGQEAQRDLHRAQPRGDARFGRQPRAQRGDQPRRRRCERDHQAVEIVGRHMQVAVGEHQHVVPGRRQHVDEVAHLSVRPVRRRVFHDRHVQRRVRRAQPRHREQRRVVGILHAEHELEGRIGLRRKRGERRVERRLVAVQRPQHADRRQRGRRWPPAAREAPHRDGAQGGYGAAEQCGGAGSEPDPADDGRQPARAGQEARGAADQQGGEDRPAIGCRAVHRLARWPWGDSPGAAAWVNIQIRLLRQRWKGRSVDPRPKALSVLIISCLASVAGRGKLTARGAAAETPKAPGRGSAAAGLPRFPRRSARRRQAPRRPAPARRRRGWMSIPPGVQRSVITRQYSYSTAGTLQASRPSAATMASLKLPPTMTTLGGRHGTGGGGGLHVTTGTGPFEAGRTGSSAGRGRLSLPAAARRHVPGEAERREAPPRRSLSSRGQHRLLPTAPPRPRSNACRPAGTAERVGALGRAHTAVVSATCTPAASQHRPPGRQHAGAVRSRGGQA